MLGHRGALVAVPSKGEPRSGTYFDTLTKPRYGTRETSPTLVFLFFSEASYTPHQEYDKEGFDENPRDSQLDIKMN